MRGVVFVAAALFGISSLPAPGQEAMPSMSHGGMQMEGMKKPVVPTGPVEIRFNELHLSFTAEELARLPRQQLSVWNEHTKSNQTYTGTPLWPLLVKLGVPEAPHGRDLRLYVVVSGADGYAAVYALAEINPAVHGDDAILADTVDGKPLGQSGPLQMVVAGDKRPARWVRNLTTITVRVAE